MPQAGIAIYVTTFAVRTTPGQSVHHALNTRPVRHRIIKPDFTTYSTHDLMFAL
jgi:hypothetical protein